MEKGFTAKSRMGCTDGMADALYRLELDLAGHQGGIARFAADFLRRDTFCDRSHRSSGSVGWTRPVIAAARLRLRAARFYRRPDVCRKLRSEEHTSELQSRL